MTRLRFGYNTNGLAHHRLEDALELIAGAGYDGVALTLDVQHLDPYRATPSAVRDLRRRLASLGLSCVVETGARYILDPNRKHWPTLLSREGAAVRRDFLERAVAVAADLGSTVVSIWSGAAEPGMFVDTLAAWRELRARVPHPRLALTLDLGHVLCEPGGDPAAAVRAHAKDLVNVQAEDMKRGVHEHLPFGRGDLDLPAALRALAEAGYGGLVAVELSRDSHRAADAVRESMAALRAAAPA